MIEQLRGKVLDFFASRNLAAGMLIPRKPFEFQLVLSLNPVERKQLETVFQQLLDEGFIFFDESVAPSHGAFLQFRLTETGEARLYTDEFNEQETPAPPSGITGQQYSNVPISGSTVVYNISHSNVQVGHHNKQILGGISEDDIRD